MNNPYTEFVNFFKKHNLYDVNIFNYLRYNSIQFDYHDDEKRPYIGYHYLTDKNDILTKIKLYVPYIDSHKTILINIHEYIHGIILYNKLEKKFKQEIDSEILPILYEKIYLLENPSKELEDFLNYLNNRITKDNLNLIQYKIALEVQDEMLKYYNEEKPTFIDLQKKAKKLSRRYKHK